MTRGQLKTQILNDLARTDMTDAVSSAISSAISHYETEKWWFLETTSEVTTTASVASYTLPSGFLDPDSVLVTISGQKQPMSQKSFHEINEKDSGIFTGYPDEYCLYQDEIRFYPIPNGEYVATISYDAQINELSDSASNAWTNTGRNLIRQKAAREIYQSKLLDENNASLAGSAEMNEYARLRTLHLLKTTKGKIRKTEW